MELLTTAEMAEADRRTIAGGVPGYVLMTAAGRAVADAARDIFDERDDLTGVVVVAGVGNNGGDGFVAARFLADAGIPVDVMLVGTRDTLRGDAAAAAADWRGAVMAADPEMLDARRLIIDALFGAGLDRAVEGLARRMIEAMNASRAPIVAVDLPSGINGTTGQAMGLAVRATETVTFFRKKPGHLLMPGRVHAGRVRLADIGIPAAVIADIKPRTHENLPDLWERQFPVPAVDAHKYARGHAVVVSGGPETTGAARLAARGALRAGSGLVTLATPSAALAINAAASTAVMVRVVDTPVALGEFLSDRRRNACVLGPGLGVGGQTRDGVLTALASSTALVLDADALTSFEGQAERLFEAIKARANPQVILTPHNGEFTRLFRALMPEDEARSKLEETRLAAAMSGAVVVAKGPDTVVASPDGRAAIAGNAPPWLATAGSGDVLAGIAGAMLAQGMPAFEAAAAAVWMHAEAGAEAGPGLIAEDLPEVLPAVFRRLFDRLGVDY